MSPDSSATTRATITNAYSGRLRLNPVVGLPAWDSAFAYINSGTITRLCHRQERFVRQTAKYGFVAINNGGVTTNDYWYAPQSGSPARIDNSTATQLTLAQSTNFASYANFDPAIWAPRRRATRCSVRCR